MMLMIMMITPPLENPIHMLATVTIKRQTLQ
jgi:hypothetical protein